jgi:hypothetical protein
VPEIRSAGRGNAITCGGCPATWSGIGKCHCSTCHRTFSALSGFDLHRSRRGPHGSCVDPATLLTGTGAAVLIERDSVWSAPAMDADTMARVVGGTP